MSQRTRSATERIYCWSFDCIEMMVSSLFHDYLVSGISKKQFTESLSYMIKEQLESLRKNLFISYRKNRNILA